MKDRNKDSKDKRSELRRRAELRAAEQLLNISEVLAQSPEKVQQLIHELQVHKIELEMQNEELRQSEALYRDLVENIEDLVCKHDLHGNLIFANSSSANFLGYDSADLIGTNLRSYLVPEVRDQFDAYLAAIQRDGCASGLMIVQTKTGEKRIWEYRNILRRESATDPVVLGIARDVTDRKRAEEALLTSEAQLSNAAKMAHLGHWEYDVAKDLFTFNDHFYQLFRTSAEQVGGYTMSSADYARRFVHPDDIKVVGDEIRKAIETRDPLFSRQLEHRILYADGEIGYITVRFFIVKDNLGRTVRTYGVNQDVTERKGAEEALRQSEERLELALEGADLGLWDLDVQTGNAVVNQRAADLVGYSLDEIDPTFIFFLSRLHPDDRSRVMDQLEKSFKGQIELSEVEYRVLAKSDEWKWILSRGRVVERDANGAPLRMVGTFMDITDRKDAEKEKETLAAQLAQAQKMESIGTLAGGIAHDFNNLLTVIQGFSEVLLMEMDKEAPGYSDLLKIHEAGLRGAELVRNLLAFSRKADIKPRPINLNHEVVRIEKLLSRTIPKMIKIDLHLEGDLAAVNADPDQIGQILMNLAVNAEQAMPDGGNLTIATTNVTLDEEYCRSYPEIHPGDYVMLSVSDTGKGMEKGILGHVFEPFFTTKDVGKGTGLGLATVYGIVKLHGGHICCDSEPNRGATFKTYLPAIEEDTTERGVKEEQVLPPGGTETILLVDDEDFIRDLGAKFLTMAGYTVLNVASGPEAVQLYLREGEQISLVILDLIMPEMGGDKCLEEILAINPDAKIVISSGAAVEGKKKVTIESGAKGFVSKPFQLWDMLKTVRQVLDSA
ncbi:MAG: PAS domain S-box protein [Desulfomonilaceae bacterium]